MPEALVPVLAVVGVCAVILLAILLLISRMGTPTRELGRRRAELELRRGRAQPATARVVSCEPLHPRPSMDQHGFGAYHEVEVELALDEGAGSRRVQATWDVKMAAMPKVALDEEVAVLVDALEPGFVMPSEPWARTSITRWRLG